MLKFLLRISLFMAFAVVFLELFFWFGMTARQYPRGFQERETGVFKFDTSWVTQGTGSFGPYCLPMGKWRLNNAGWNSIFDYHSRDDYSKPRIAIIGNSYIEGWAADVENHIGPELERLLESRANVYSFGISGATFAQYLGMLPHIEERYDPDLYVMILSEFGISRSLEVNFSPFRFFVAEDDSGLALHAPRRIFSQNKYGRIIFRSSLARYLYFNRQIGAKKLDVDVDEMLVGSSASPVTPELLAAGRFFLDSFEDLVPEDRVIFLADGNREAIYQGLSEYQQGLDYRILEGLIIPETMFSMVDLTEFMRNDYSVHSQVFSPEYDPHWNTYAHGVAAKALLPHVVADLKELGF